MNRQRRRVPPMDMLSLGPLAFVAGDRPPSPDRQPEHLMLARPFGRHVTEPGHADATGQPPVDGGFDQIGRQECQRDGHVDLARATALLPGDAGRGGCSIGDDPIEPVAPRQSGASPASGLL